MVRGRFDSNSPRVLLRFGRVSNIRAAPVDGTVLHASLFTSLPPAIKCLTLVTLMR